MGSWRLLWLSLKSLNCLGWKRPLRASVQPSYLEKFRLKRTTFSAGWQKIKITKVIIVDPHFLTSTLPITACCVWNSCKLLPLLPLGNIKRKGLSKKASSVSINFVELSFLWKVCISVHLSLFGLQTPAWCRSKIRGTVDSICMMSNKFP